MSMSSRLAIFNNRELWYDKIRQFVRPFFKIELGQREENEDSTARWCVLMELFGTTNYVIFKLSHSKERVYKITRTCLSLLLIPASSDVT